MSNGGFHKWHSNVADVESTDDLKANTTTTKMLGTSWNKTTAELSIIERVMLASIKAICDVLRLASPVTITGKIIFSKVCAPKLKWGEPLPNHIMKRRDEWIKNLQRRHFVTVPGCDVGLHTRVIPLYRFSDASSQAVCAAIHIISVCQHC